MDLYHSTIIKYNRNTLLDANVISIEIVNILRVVKVNVYDQIIHTAKVVDPNFFVSKATEHFRFINIKL